MIKMNFSWLAEVLEAPFSGQNLAVANINTDTRTITDNEVFLALKGANFDGHKFVAQAKQKGAIAAIVSEPVDVDIVQFVVADTRIALGQLGQAVMQHVAPKTVAITGSVGKTTVKEMTAAILSRRGKVLATKGNFNNDIGVPLTLLRLSEDDEYAVIELGANHIGEIAYTSGLTKPDVAVVCNVAPSHLEGFGSIEGIGQAKGEIFGGLKDQGVAIINCDSEFAPMWEASLGEQSVKRFSMQDKLDVWAEDIQLDEFGCAEFSLCTEKATQQVKLALPGKHNVMNAVIAASLTLPFGTSLQDIAIALKDMPVVKGRVNVIDVSSALRVVDDTYNANVRSVKAAIELLKDMPGTRVLALGDMAELGEEARAYHQEVGEFAQQQGIDAVFTLGVLSRYASEVFEQPNRHFSTREHMLEVLSQFIENETGQCTLLVKGSRSARMELLVADLISAHTNSERGDR
ncbi:UDP-N-acetylmuramoyl-tripeptide--D-alanyl-D-alanine ligase [Pseudoalteromonas luteoviolacea]|uniref:UDP-N-acetylmuramoyl-tripeptide--D-alanyl-D- alanine ligase n=1 Tax=Pseudoalteromonas luteoviolacea TaxID=43657 RepID=UPI001B3A6908|nr:UDP-N-acetylmuramoyl-tripeptide--D-alanyl-D-alanine ligase [Pseudoalteromonas luteoviolacea]MBQ4876834.1 UDP-N-acetylmuramoyl-tripeptide--D-alanyl-D-alanine ligase [Pseudoalteromonas luteoviolacea]MBQ4905377.1 UDP-N-acetylmuramoyl-tripeptide--D-alanyl-D-alanine ligase [Pseudoalteromonas luteoviolacea]